VATAFSNWTSVFVAQCQVSVCGPVPGQCLWPSARSVFVAQCQASVCGPVPGQRCIGPDYVNKKKTIHVPFFHVNIYMLCTVDGFFMV